jgi:mono/diheme cytochrome c family protein
MRSRLAPLVLLATLTWMPSMSARVASQQRAAAAPAAAVPKGDAVKGKDLFYRYGCEACHGREGQGGMAGPRLAPNPMPLAAFVRYVRAPRGVMPPYTEKLLKSDQELTDIHAYLSTRAQPAPASVLEP